MPVFVDPRTGERYDNVPEEDVGRAQVEFGLVPLEQYEADKAFEQKPLGEKIEQGIGAFGAGLGRGVDTVTKPLADIGLIEGMSPEERAAFEERAYTGAEAKEGRARFPFVSAVAESAPIAAAGAVTGGAGLGLRTSAALLGAESTAAGFSQEKIEATIEDRAFSVDSALSNGAMEFLFGVIPMTAGASAARKSAPKLGKNLLAEAEETAGTAASQRAFKAGEPRWMSEAPTAKSAGSASADFTDDMWDKAVGSIDDAKLDKEAVFLAQNEPHFMQLTTTQASDNLDEVYRIMKEDINEATRAKDFELGAKEWTPKMIERQDQWISKRVGIDMAEDIEAIKTSKAAAATGEGFDAGGLGAEAISVLKNNRARILKAEGAERNIALNQGKQALDKMIKRVQKSRTVDTGAQKFLIDVLQTRADILRKEGLEDVKLFGRNAKLQKELNGAYVKTLDPLNRVNQKLSKIIGQDFGEVGAASINRQAQSEAVGAMLRKPIEFQREFAADLSAALDGVEELSLARSSLGLSHLDQLGTLRQRLRDLKDDFNFATTLQVAKRRASEVASKDPSIMETVASEIAGIATTGLPGVGSTVGRVGRRLFEGLKNAPSAPKPGTPLGDALSNRMKAYSRQPLLADKGFSRNLPEWMRASLKGHGGNVAAVAGVVGAGAALAPGEAGAAELDQRDPRVVQALNNVAQSTRGRVEAAVTDLFDSSLDKGKGKRSYQTGSYKKLLQKAEKSGLSLSMTRFLGKSEDPESAYEQKKAVVMAMATDPSALVDRMAASWGDLPQEQPEVYAQLVMQASKVAAYLHAKLPATVGKSLLNKEGYPPTLEEIDEYSGYWQGAIEPLSVIDDIASGNVSDEAMQAVKEVWPKLFAEYQGAALGQMTRLMNREEDIESGTIEYLDRVLELEGAGEPMLGWDMALLIENAEKYVAEHPGEAGEETGAQPAQMPRPQPINTGAPERLTSKSLQGLRVPA